jgi:hypothetical protein
VKQQPKADLLLGLPIKYTSPKGRHIKDVQGGDYLSIDFKCFANFQDKIKNIFLFLAQYPHFL